jgi:hypothetical protein
MEPFFDCGLFELVLVGLALLTCLNFVYKSRLSLTIFSVLSLAGCAYFLVVSKGFWFTAMAVSVSVAMLVLNIWIWIRKISHPDEQLFKINSLKESVLAFFKIKIKTNNK